MLGSTLFLYHSLKGDKVEALLEVIDILFTAFVAGPLVIIYWKATWALMDLYIYPKDKLLSAVWTAALGITIGLVLCAVQEILSKMIAPEFGRKKYFFLTRLYTCVAAVISVAACRGIWNLLEYFFDDPIAVILCTFASATAIIALRAVRNLDSAPFCITVDTAEDYFGAPTFYKTVCLRTFFCLFFILIFNITSSIFFYICISKYLTKKIRAIFFFFFKKINLYR